MGLLMLRRRLEPTLVVDVFEVQLGDAFLMSSLFTATEEAVADLGLAALDGDGFDVLVGGLGLGHTAATALDDPRVGSVWVVEVMDAVIDWHVRGLVPLGPRIVGDPRCRLVHGDFFGVLAAGGAFVDESSVEALPHRFDAVLLDIDHTPRHHLSEAHAPFYSPEGLRAVVDVLRPGGVFALWSDDPPDAPFVELLASVFATAEATVVTFPNVHTSGESACTVYVAARSG